MQVYSRTLPLLRYGRHPCHHQDDAPTLDADVSIGWMLVSGMWKILRTRFSSIDMPCNDSRRSSSSSATTLKRRCCATSDGRAGTPQDAQAGRSMLHCIRSWEIVAFAINSSSVGCASLILCATVRYNSSNLCFRCRLLSVSRSPPFLRSTCICDSKFSFLHKVCSTANRRRKRNINEMK